MLGLTFRQLQIFVEVVDLGSFGACAERMGITQVSVSGHIRAMERVISRTLFQRRKGAASELTEDGHLVYRHAVPLLERALDLTAELGSRETSKRRRLIVLGPGYATFRLTSVLAEFGQRFPEYQIEISPDDSHRAVEIVARGDADIGFHIAREGALPPECEVIAREPIGFYVGRNHVLAARATVTKQELAACPLIQLPRKDMLRDLIEAALADLGVRGNPTAVQTGNVTLVRRMLMQGEAMACLFASMAADDVESGDLVKLPLEIDLPDVEIGMVASRSLRRAANTLLTLARDELSKGLPVEMT